MKIHSTRLRGFIGIKQGLGLDEVSVDLSGVNGLIAFDGPNGKGKSTLLEAGLQPFRCLASRKGALQHHCFLRDSERELNFSSQGADYRTLVKIDAQSGRQEGFVWRNGAPQVNGKSSEYDRYITELFGSSNLFFNSVFCAQNSSKISDMTTGELKSLFSEFLRLQRYVDFEETSKQCVRMLLGQKEKSEQEIERLSLDIGTKFAGVSERLEAAQESYALNSESIADAAMRVEKTEAELTEANNAAAKNEIIKRQLSALRKAEAEIESEATGLESQSAAELKAVREKAQAIVLEIQGLEEVLKDKDKIFEAQEKKDTLTTAFEGAKTELSEAQISLTAAIKTTGEWQAKTNAGGKILTDLKHDESLRQLNTEIHMFESTAKSLELKDPACQSKACSFISEAVKAAEKLPSLISIRDKLQAKIQAEVEAKEVEIALLNDQERIAKDQETDLANHAINLKREILKLDAELKEVFLTSLKIRDIETAEVKLEGLKQRKQELIDQGLQTKDRYEQQIVAVFDRRLKVQDQIKEFEGQYDHFVEKRVENKTRELDGLKSEVAVMRGRAEALTREIAGLEQKVKERIEVEATLEAQRKRLRVLANEASDWKYLQQACGKDGLRALEIDSVAPLVTGYSNELLANTFGPSFSVRFRTQDDEGREVLDILVIREDGTEVLLDNLSGGQKVWNLKAIRLAMTLLSKDKSGRNFQSAFCDEEDGALDVENALRFIDLYRAFMASGGFNDCYFISHKPECVALADHRVIFNGGITVE